MADGDGDYWHLRAQCRRTSAEYFFAPENEGRDNRLRRERVAKQICRSCPVLLSCRTYAVDARESYGIWGATTPRERQRLIRVSVSSSTARRRSGRARSEECG